jgi:competence protein ComEC
MIALAVAALILAMWTARRRIVLTSVGLFPVFLVALAWAFVAPRPDKHSGVMEVTAIDVGEGDSILVITPNGKTLLVDAAVPLAPAARNSTSAKMWSRETSLNLAEPTCGYSSLGLTGRLETSRRTATPWC